ncbi:metallophosphoesterase [Planococcus halotolerans]|uniref:Metallophosphoesterase n=2 Tax=Planococcus halotolerans TaxID=2233542 RepID=A0A365L6W2_9BACL|nr:metallophosphoesterase [Planococcus halotolerans]
MPQSLKCNSIKHFRRMSMKKILSVSLATVLVASTLPSLSFAATNVGQGEVSSIAPADHAKNVDRNAVLEAVIKDPNGSSLKTVDFMEGFTYDYASSNNVNGFFGTSDSDPLTSPLGGTAFTDSNKGEAAVADGNYAVTDAQGAYPYHRFEVDVSKHLEAGNEIELSWQGKTSAEGKLILSAWDYTAGKWVVLEDETANQGGNIVFSKVLADSKFFQNGKVQAMVHDAAASKDAVVDNSKFTMAWFTDTQFYAAEKPEVWTSMTNWMIEEYSKGRFGYVINSGDLVNISTDLDQWAVADENLTRMDEANIPYGVMAGNRDVVNQDTMEIDYTNFWTYAGKDRYEGKPWYGEQMDNNRNHYDLFSFGAHDFIILYLGYGKVREDETIQWTNQMLAKHSDKNAILVVHNYLSPGGYRSQDGTYIFDNVVRKSPNVKMVLGGHYFGADREIRTVTDPDGTTREILEVLSNYQGKDGAEGYMRLLTFDPATDTVDFDTYSPYHDDYNYFEDGSDDFTEGYKLEPTEAVEVPAVRQIATDYIAVNVFTDDVIGSVSNLASGNKASVEWNELEPLTQYFWYVNITNASDQKKTSKIYRFTTNDAALPEPGEPDPDEPIESSFPDIIGTKYEWALDEIEAMVARGIITGQEDGTFKPGNSIQRQHVALMFTKAIDLNKVVPPTPFADVPKTSRFYDEIMAVQEAGIFVGNQNKFYPIEKMTRAEMAKVLVVAFDIELTGTHPFTDVPANHWAAKYIGPLYSSGITAGKSKTIFDLNGEVSRAEFAAFMYRALEYKEKNQ